ncbi:TPA: site-specific DNA-methyltransferase [Streptococcus suis]|nr:site-specific DNA-methyltransferase [Streptococcus suis]HEM5139221.1 site-specific DNA-methyltransferase [Streptococcus suis]HEM5245730.1 site-specific DNA-methyltransferase [Streptococcus suis]
MSTAQHSTAQQKLGEYTQVEKLDLSSKDILSDNIAKIGQLFPEVLTESSDENGRLRPAIDFDKLRQFLSREIVEGRESYEFTWVGKRGAIAEAGKPTTQTLRPDLEESVDFDKSENVFITGDNLEVLKVLQESYLGKIDMIYIDPPYNTGKDFVYRDRSQLSEKELEELSKQRNENDELLFKFETNAKQSAKYHSDWLNMMYPRLVLARNLLKDSGVIFISIDDNEQANLKAICDEIFGEGNFVGEFIRKVMEGGKSDSKGIAIEHENCLVYLKNPSTELNKKPVQRQEHYNKKDEYFEERGYYYLKPLENGGLGYIESLDYAIEGPDLVSIFPGGQEGNNGYRWVWSRDKFLKALSLGMIEFTRSQKDKSKYKVYYKIYEKIDTDGNYSEKRLPFGTLYLDGYTNRQAVLEVKKLFGDQRVFDYPKPTSFVKETIKLGLKKEGIILDFFAGSATTADAVMQLNAEDGGNRKYILCTLDEQVADKSAAKEAGYETIDQISRERIRRAAKKIQEEHPETVGKQDFGFRAYKLDSSNFKDVSQTPDSFSQESLFDSVSNIKDGRTDLDFLFQIMLTWGMELSLPIAKTQIDGTAVYNVADGALIACFADEISESVIRQIAKEEPLRAVFKDESFANSAAKINLGQIFKEETPNTKVKVV